ncbi:MAG TPA: hypothetical protein VKU89_00275 [Solirubrobacteraceae bacterium]|nr:hypothetical protein [Solirubrobacteraceae bacterium]
MGSDSELQALLSRPLAAVAPEVAGAIESGPIDPRQALSADRPEGVIESGDEAAQTGWCLLADGSAYTAVRTLMAGVSGRMLDWWFEWHALHPLRYRIWYPRAHFDISVELPEAPGAKPYWGAIHHPVEDIGLGRAHLRIAFCDPLEFGFPAAALERPEVATVICGLVGDDRKRAWHTRICHCALERPEGVELRSRFWIGSALGLYTRRGPAGAINRLLATPLARRALIPREAPLAMARHCAAEYANLAALLPELYARYSGE